MKNDTKSEMKKGIAPVVPIGKKAPELEELTVKIAIRTLDPMIPAIGKLVNSFAVKGKQGYWLGRLAKDIDAAMEIFSKRRMEVIRAFAMRNEKGEIVEAPQGVSLDPEKLDDFNREINELLDMELEFVLRCGIFKVNINDLEVDSKPLLTPAEMAALEGLFIEWQGI